jgi:L-fuculose-phosphate aldolase
VSEARLRQQLAEISTRIWQQGWVANHDGNLSARLPRDRLLCTPSGVSKAAIAPQMMLVVDLASGRLLSGAGKPFSELDLHRAWYQARPDVQAVIHSHAPTATGFGVAGIELDHPLLPEAVVSLGVEIPTVPLTMPGTEAVQAIAPFVEEHDALLLAGNGVLAAGSELQQAYLRMELVEHLCRIALVARQLGGARPLPAQLVGSLLAARARAGLGPEGRGTAGSPQPTPRSGPRPGGDPQRDLERVVRDEIARVLAPRR